MVDSATPLGSRGREDVLSAGNLPMVGLPTVTTKVCPLQGQMLGEMCYPQVTSLWSDYLRLLLKCVPFRDYLVTRSVIP